MNQNNLSIKEEHINETQNMIQTGKKPETKLETKSEIETEIRTKEVRITKAELKKLVIATAIHFYEKGVKSRDVVAICLENSLEYIITFLAVTYFGAIVSPINPSYSPVEIMTVLEDMGSVHLILPYHNTSKSKGHDNIITHQDYTALDKTQKDVAVANMAEAREIQCFCVDFESETKQLHIHSNDKMHSTGSFDLISLPTYFSSIISTVTSDTIALLLQTSGTTNRPKIVPLTHQNLLLSAHHIGSFYRLSPGDRCLLIVPLFHIHGIVAGFLTPLLFENTIILQTPKFMQSKVWSDVVQYNCTWITAVPAMYQILLAKYEKMTIEEQAKVKSDIQNSPLRFLRSSSSSLLPSVLGKLRTLIGDSIEVVQAYSMTEASHQMSSTRLGDSVIRSADIHSFKIESVGQVDEFGVVIEDEVRTDDVRADDEVEGNTDTDEVEDSISSLKSLEVETKETRYRRRDLDLGVVQVRISIHDPITGREISVRMPEKVQHQLRAGSSINNEDSTPFTIHNIVDEKQNMNEENIHNIQPQETTQIPSQKISSWKKYIGEICVTGPTITRGYLRNPDANKLSFHISHVNNTTVRWFRTGDEGYIDEDGYLYITGRLKELINRGGEKISPVEIDKVLLECPFIAQAVSFGVPDVILGQNINAAVVIKRDEIKKGRENRIISRDRMDHIDEKFDVTELKSRKSNDSINNMKVTPTLTSTSTSTSTSSTNNDIDTYTDVDINEVVKDLQDFLQTRLSPFKIPTKIYVVDELPKTSTGKLQRNNVAKLIMGEYEGKK